MQCMEVKLGTHVYLSVSMTTINKNGLGTLLNITTSPLKLAHHTMHGGETLYACVFKCFHDDYQQKMPSGIFPITTSSLLKLAHHTMHGGETWYACVFKCFHDDHQQKMASGTFTYNYFFTSQTCTPCNAWRLNFVCMCISVFPWRPLTKKWPQALFLITTSSLLKLAHHAMHGG